MPRSHCQLPGFNGRGIPIGNLTSQIFANIYLHEFDRFVRHSLKPQAYIRYGDDVVLFDLARRSAHQCRKLAVDYLAAELKLAINPKNNVIVAASNGLYYLGHVISKDFLVIDKHTTNRIIDKLGWDNVSSYRALPLVNSTRQRLDWILLEKYVDI